MASSSSGSGNKKDAIWEEADSEFYSEAFLSREHRDDGDNNSRDSTLASTRSSELTMETVIHRPMQPNTANSLTSRLLAAGHGHGKRNGGSGATGSGTGNKGSRSARMKAAIQGLGSEDEDNEDDDYAGGNNGNGNNGGFDFFISENVITPLESWRKLQRLKCAPLSLKSKRRIKKQYQVSN